MKICILAPNYYTSVKKFPKRIYAPRSFAVNLVYGLAERGHKVYFATAPDVNRDDTAPISGDKDLLYKKLAMDKHLRRQQMTERDIFESFFINKEYYELDLIKETIISANEGLFDIIHTDYPLVHFLEAFCHVPIVYTLHEPLPEPGTLEYWVLSKYKDHRYISISRSQEKGDVKINFIETVLHGIDLREFPFSPQSQGDYLAFIGRLVQNKGAYAAAQAAESVDLKLYIATEPVYKENSYYTNQIAPFVKKGRLCMMGYLTGKKRIDFFQKARALLFPIEWEEPFGLVMIEAMACGTPVVAYARGSVSEVIVDGTTGFIIEPQNRDGPCFGVSGQPKSKSRWIVKKKGIEGLIEAVKRINSMNSREYAKMRLACRKHVEENFTVERMVEDYERVYRKVLSIKY